MDVTGWEDDTWILHDLTVPLDPDDPEEGPRARCRWRDLADADLIALQRSAKWPPNAMYLLKGHRWPEICIEEGTFDGESRSALLEILTAVSDQMPGASRTSAWCPPTTMTVPRSWRARCHK
jgi:hypothetical protein